MNPFLMPLLAAKSDSSWTQVGPMVVGSVIIALVLVWTAVFAVEWWRQREPRRKLRQTSLLDQLCLAHGLDARQQEQVVNAARGYAHGDVVMTFLDPRILENASRKSPELVPLGRLLFGSAWRDTAEQ